MTVSARTRLQGLLAHDAVIYGYDVTPELVSAFIRYLKDSGATADDVERALLEHRRHTDTRFTPVVVHAFMRRQRGASRLRLHYAPPESLDGDPARELPWLRTYNDHCSGGMAPKDAYLAACAEHRCDPGDVFPSPEARQRAYALIEDYAQRARGRTDAAVLPSRPGDVA